MSKWMLVYYKDKNISAMGFESKKRLINSLRFIKAVTGFILKTEDDKIIVVENNLTQFWKVEQ